MSRITSLFKTKQANILNVYCTAGFPRFDDTLQVIKSLEENGADMIELGMPYSDPLADGSVIQHSSAKALRQGMTIAKLFDQLRNFRSHHNIQLPVVLMGYMNPVMQYGFEKFCAEAAAVGIDGLILPDLPAYEYKQEYAATIKKYDLDFIFLVTPETSDDRVKQLDGLSSGFLYAVSSSSTTGNDKDFNVVEKYLQKLNRMKLKNPLLVGFGIKDKATFDTACRYANGGIIGSAYVKALEEADDVHTATKKFINNIKA